METQVVTSELSFVPGMTNVIRAKPFFEVDEDGDLVYQGKEDRDEFLSHYTTRDGRAWAYQQLARSDEVLKHMSPPGALGLPKLLEKRRLAAGIADEHFRQCAGFAKIYVYQIPFFDQERIGGVELSPVSKQMLKESAPRGIILSAGLEAMDQLVSHGYELGDIVNLQKHTPYRFPVCFIAGHPEYTIMMTVGELCGGEDIACRIWRGELTLKLGSDGKHFYARKTNDD